MKNKTQIIGVLGFSVLYNWIFWNEIMGINILLFSSLLIAFLLYQNPNARKSRSVQLVALLTLFTGCMVVFHNSFVSKFGHIIIGFTFVGLVHHPAVQTSAEAAIRYILRFLTSISVFPKLYDEIAEQLGQRNKRIGYYLANLKLLILPTIGFGIFFLIFTVANPVFGELSDTLLNTLFKEFNRFFKIISPRWLAFTVFGVYFVLSIIIKNTTFQNRLDNLVFSLGVLPSDEPNSRAISNEYKIALALIFSVNLLLLVVNSIDFRYLWFDFEQSLSSAQNLSKLVHEGTYLLIFSSLLSILILLYFFRKDLNFKTNNGLLKTGAYIWIIQNAFLITSVFLRNQKYIVSYGLTHKRIGVAIFLLLTLIGLITMFLKINKIRSFYYVFKTNTWAWLIGLASLSAVDWDSQIVRYNLKNQAPQTIDFQYLLSDLSYHTYPMQYEYFRRHEGFDKHQQKIENRMRIFLKNQQYRSWLSWNIADAQTVRFFENKNNMTRF